ncbi:MAG TPA: NAD-dependent succinate-semialdehyde dehydrogenase [Limnochordales bacterium]|nr:NAD-dependent succinate-semialdehyde dehydrogenase [Limnochordales bacterium]
MTQAAASQSAGTATHGLFINGQWTPAKTGRTFAVTDPATGETLATVADAGREDTRAAIEAAHAAFPAWSRTPAMARGRILRHVAALMRERKETLARQLTREMGKPITEARGEIEYAASFLDWFAGEGERVYGDIIPQAVPGKRHLVLKQPVGVVAAITPWNFPAAMVTRKVAPALAAGCTVVLKPAEQTPLTAISLMELFAQAGLPAGVLNLITAQDPRPVGEEMLQNPLVRKITFTGSTEVGKYLMREAAHQVKRISLELGGHAPVIVFDDADLDKAVQGTLASKFRNMGQTCVCANRVYVQRGILEEFSRRFAAAVSRLRVGNGLDETVQVGPLIDAAGLEKVKAHVEDAIAKGARALTGAKVLTGDGFRGGCYYAPTVLVDVREGMRIMEEETFGPVAPIIAFDTEAEAYARANDSRYGLAAYVFTQNLDRAIRAAEHLEYGIVGINEGLPSTAQVPFGGFKESGIGREGGPYGIHEFLEIKMVGLAIDETVAGA